MSTTSGNFNPSFTGHRTNMSPQTLEGSRWCKIAHQESESPMTLSGCMFSFIWYNLLASRLPGRWIPRGLFHPDHQYISADHNWFCVPSSPVTGLDEFVLSWTQTVTTEDLYVLARYYKGKKTLGKGGVKNNRSLLLRLMYDYSLLNW